MGHYRSEMEIEKESKYENVKIPEGKIGFYIYVDHLTREGTVILKPGTYTFKLPRPEIAIVEGSII